MARRIPIGSVAAIALGFFLHLDSVLAQRVRRWADTGSASRGVFSDGVAFKRLTVDGVELRAALSDLGHSFALRLEVVNGGPGELQVDEALAELESIHPGVQAFRRLSAGDLAKHVRRTENSRASGIEALGAMALTTRPEAVPVTEVSPNPAHLADPTQPPTIVTTKTEIVVNTVPDDAERLRAAGEGSAIRREADQEARAVVDRALRSTRLQPGAQAMGAVYFEPDRQISEVLVRVILPTAHVEIPSRRLDVGCSACAGCAFSKLA